MILLALRDYLVRQETGNLTDMAHRFDLDPHALSGMLEHWIKKGKVRKVPTGTFCDKCSGCDVKLMETYEWVKR